MGSVTVKKVIIPALICSLLFTEVASALASDKKLQVAFVGLKFENLPQEAQDILTWRMGAILESQEGFTLTKPDAAQIVYGRGKIAQLVEKQDAESFQTFAKQLGFAHVFSGKLRNNSQDENHLFLVGELDRYDVSTDEIQKYPINIDYDKFGNELVQFSNQYVESLGITKRHRNPWSMLLVGGIIVGAALTIRFGLGAAGGEEGSDPDSSADN